MRKCQHCNAIFCRTSYARKHELTCVSKRTCRHCQQIFPTPGGRNVHENVCPTIDRRCNKCNATFCSSNAHKMHERTCRKRQRSESPQRTYFCRRCNFSSQGRRDLTRHITMQHGGATATQDFDPNFREDQQLEAEYNANRRHILRPHQQTATGAVYNFPTNNLEGEGEIQSFLDHIYDNQQSSFRVNMSLGFILRDRNGENYRYFIPYENSYLLPANATVTNYRDLQALVEQLQNMDIQNYLRNQRPNSSLLPYVITNIVFYVTDTHYPLGCSDVQLPDYIVKSKSIISLSKNKNAKTYTDNLCMFRCLQYHREKNVRASSVQNLFKNWCEFRGKVAHIESFKGVEIAELPFFEECFRVCVNVYSLDSKIEIPTPVYLSTEKYKGVMYLNMYQKHVSFISNFKAYAKKVSCEKCSRIFSQVKYLKQHFRHCSMVKKYRFMGGYKEKPETIFEKLKKFGINVGVIFYDYFACFDFEALLKKIDVSTGKKLKFVSEHIPVSFAVNSNVPPFNEPKFFLSKNVETLVQDLVSYLEKISGAAALSMKEKLKDAYDAIETQLQDTQEKSTDHSEPVGFDDDSCSSDSSDVTESDINFIDNSDIENSFEYPNPYLNPVTYTEKAKKKPKTIVQHSFLKLKRELDRFCCQLPVLGFNSRNYDINLIKRHLIKILDPVQNKDFNIIKKCNSYISISTDKFQFLDVASYLSPNVSYAQFLKCYNAPESKGIFPYEFLDSYEKLNFPRLPEPSDFYSSLKEKNLLGDSETEISEAYKNLEKFWRDQKFQTLKDMLLWYNTGDVLGFKTAVENMQKFYQGKGVSIFKEAVTISSYSRKQLFRSTSEVFACFDHKKTEIFTKQFRQTFVEVRQLFFIVK